MSKNRTDNELTSEALQSIRFWETHSSIILENANCRDLKKQADAFVATANDVEMKESELALKMSERDSLAAQVREVVTRLRSAVKGIYGPDSPEYEQLGGPRKSDRRRPARKAKAVVAPVTDTQERAAAA